MTISSYLIYRKIRSRLRSIFNNLFKQPENVDVDIQKIIQYIIQKDEIKNVLQIGSNDGLKNDPLNFWINNFNLNVILIEPLEDNFWKLKENYSSAKSQIIFQPAFRDWGFVSGVAVIDNSTFGAGNLLMYAQLRNPRYIYTGDQIKFDVRSLEISLT